MIHGQQNVKFEKVVFDHIQTHELPTTNTRLHTQYIHINVCNYYIIHVNR
jgi:hypothetical protein